MKTHSYNHRISNQYLTKISSWRGKHAPAACFTLAVTYLQFKQSWGQCSVPDGERRRSEQEWSCFSCQASQRLSKVSRTLLLSYHILCYDTRLRNSWILEIKSCASSANSGTPQLCQHRKLLWLLFWQYQLLQRFSFWMLLIAQSICCVLNFVLSYTSTFFFLSFVSKLWKCQWKYLCWFITANMYAIYFLFFWNTWYSQESPNFLEEKPHGIRTKGSSNFFLKYLAFIMTFSCPTVIEE